ncbi:MAG TPA: hypothetical protein VHN77_15535 [Phycisphaerales bacterium]|nr:hypothetical protein [Phycisphaerales bacterium]
MGDFFTGQAIWFTVPAIFGTLAFVVRLFLLGAGGDDGHSGGHGADIGTHGDVMGATDAMHDGADNLSGFFSVQSFLSFFMGFGWGGLGALKGLGWPWWGAVLLGLVAGLAMVLLLAVVMRNVRRLEASGNIHVRTTLGATGDVYVAVPEKGKGVGEVRLVIGDRQRMVNAVSDGAALPSKTRVKVAAVNPDNTVTVTPL